MLPSWTKRVFTGPSVHAGIVIGHTQICAAVVDVGTDCHKTRGVMDRPLPQGLFSGQPSETCEAALVETLKAVRTSFWNEFAAVRVVLPDTMIRSTVFELEELPRTDELRSALLRWRFATEWQRPEQSLDCQGMDLGEDGGKKVLLGQAIDRSWLDSVKRALGAAGIVPWSLNAGVIYRFNCFHEQVAAEAGAMVSVDPACWSVLIWDSAGRLRRVYTRPRSSEKKEDEAHEIADSAERKILAYAGGAAERNVGRLYLAGDEDDMLALAAAFNGRLREEAVLLHADEKTSCAISGIRGGWAPLAMAAALDI